jgi:site-specific recombinase XerD
MTTLPLFDDGFSQRHEVLIAAFDNWCAIRNSTSRGGRDGRLLDKSAEVYRDMWISFASFCAQRGHTLETTTSADLQLFLHTRGKRQTAVGVITTTKGPKISARYAHRFLRLIDWVTLHEAKRFSREPNNSARQLLESVPVYRYAKAATRDPAPQFLNSAATKQLIDYVTATGDAVTWKEVRNRTAVAVMLGAGLTPGEIRKLELADIVVAGGRSANIPWKLRVSGNGNAPGRETPLAEWAGLQLKHWQNVRQQQNIPNQYVFPSTSTGKPWSDTRCLEQCTAVLDAAGATPEGGLFKLRHTFALRQLDLGKSEQQVAGYLGLLDIDGMMKYRRILTTPTEVA